MNYAMKQVGNGGEVIIKGIYAYGTDGSMGVKGKAVTVSGGTLDLSNTTVFDIKGPVTLADLSMKVNDSGAIYANGNHFVVKESVAFDKTYNRLKFIFGGSLSAAVESTHMELYSGNYQFIYGGGRNGTGYVENDTYLRIGGIVNQDQKDKVFQDHDIANEYNIFGGCESASVGGNTKVVFDGTNAVAGFIYGGGDNVWAQIGGTSQVEMHNGYVMSINGGSRNARNYEDRKTAAKVIMTGGKVEQIFGGSTGSNFTGNTEVLIQGGTVTRRIYGGCYNETKSGFEALFDQSTITDYYVDGTATVTIENINYTHASSLDNVISACSRNTNNHEEEVGILKFKTQALYDSLEKYLGDSAYTNSPKYDELIIEEK